MPDYSGPRYTVRAQATGGLYCVWDSERSAVATSPSGVRRYHDLPLQEAFDAIDDLARETE
jgi:hypothetical protein